MRSLSPQHSVSTESTMTPEEQRISQRQISKQSAGLNRRTKLRNVVLVAAALFLACGQSAHSFVPVQQSCCSYSSSADAGESTLKRWNGNSGQLQQLLVESFVVALQMSQKNHPEDDETNSSSTLRMLRSGDESEVPGNVPFRRESRFRVRRKIRSAFNSLRTSDTEDLSTEDITWSRALDADKETTPRRGVRSRVRSVLAKAKNRTGIQNSSDLSGKVKSTRKIKTEQTALDVVAEAASIGGLDVTDLDYKAPSSAVNGQKQQQSEKNSRSENKTIRVNGETATLDKTTSKISETQSKPAANSSTSSTSGRSSKKSPASTFSEPIVSPPTPNPEEAFLPTAKNETSKTAPEVEAFAGDVSAAFSSPPEPLPFTLPSLTSSQLTALKEGERIQEQSKMGREGSGFVVLDVHAPPDVVWDCLLDFHSYPDIIPTVRDVQMYTNTHLDSSFRGEEPLSYEVGTFATLAHGTPSVTRAAFTLSKFRLKIAAIHKYRPHPQGDYMVFTLDPACTNAVLKSAKGVWHTQRLEENYTRVWLLCELSVSRLLPQFITDYAAKRAMPRATTWLKPQVEAAASLWLKKPSSESKK